MRAVFDTVIFVRALINSGGTWGRLIFEMGDEYQIILSPEIIEEILEVLSRPALARKLPEFAPAPGPRELLAIFQEADVVEPGFKLQVCRDPDDNKFFECAVAGAAEYIVSEDRDILDVGEYHGVKTVSAAEFMRLLTSD